MRIGEAVFVTDCEGPISKNDNAYELASHFIPNGERLFTIISRYDDIQADIIKRPGYKAGDTLKLILPFLRAYGVTNDEMRRFSSENLILVSGADQTLRFVLSIMPSFIISTSYEHYISAICSLTGFPEENVYCTQVDMDRYVLSGGEAERLKRLGEEISAMPMLEIPEGASAFEDLPEETRRAVGRLDEIFWNEIYHMDAGRMLREVNPVGGFEKANAIRQIVERTGVDLSSIIYFGDSITDVDPFRLVREAGGLTVSFNGNQYAVREAEIAVMSHSALIIAVLADLFRRMGREGVLSLADQWSVESLRGACEPQLLRQMLALPPERAPKVERITQENMSRLIHESNSFRKTVRGEAVGSLG